MNYEEPNMWIIVFDDNSIYTTLGNSDDEPEIDWGADPNLNQGQFA